MLVIAGAGSGKTRVLTTRIAYLIKEEGVRPENILAFTFTNKAAREMRERVEALSHEGRRAWIGTFHATGVRILRREAERLGYSREFSIYDADDSRAVIRTILKRRHADPKEFTPRAVATAISHFKNQSMSPREAQEDAMTGWEERMAKVYSEYEKELRSNQAMDFDDLIARTVELFEKHRDVQERYAKQFRYVLVDEFQDTNPLQLILTKALSAQWENLFAVGDDDQAIYSWRGATVENMLSFEEYFPGAKVLRLEQNYRSSGIILRAANEVIAHNHKRRGKKLWTEAADGLPLELWWVDDEEGEGSAIKSRIEELGSSEGFHRRDCVILYRTNAQSRALEDALRRAGLPYQIVGGTRFYERREVRDVLAYLKLVVNPSDQVSLQRVINLPRRGIGKKSVERLLDAAGQHDLSPLRFCELHPELLAKFCGRGASRIQNFVTLVTAMRRMAESQDAASVVEEVLRSTKYLEWLHEDDPATAEDREENVRELLHAAEAFVAESDEGRLFDFLESVALLAEVDRMDAAGDLVTLMTMHNAKGLEFPAVFVAGCEENLLPHANSVDEENRLEEERRLFYVALTRARQRVFLSAAASRRRFGGSEPVYPSRFLSEIPADIVVEKGERVSPEEGFIWSHQARTRRLFPEESHGARVSRARKRTRGVSSESSASPGQDTYGAEAFLKSRAKQRAQSGSDHGFQDHEFSQEEMVFEIGQRVRHQTLGEGTITEVEGFGELTRLTIEFGDTGRKRVLARYAKLEILDKDTDLPF
jgi:DNA helicase-2/ATP-dependent DNA helicase PcrA